MRTNIDIDDDLMQTALKVTGFQTKKKVVHEALEELIAHYQRKRIFGLRGKVSWDGDLDAMRETR